MGTPVAILARTQPREGSKRGREDCDEDAPSEEDAAAGADEQAPAAKRARRDASPSPIRQRNRPGEPASVGIVQQIYVENFMCHRKLRVELNRNINFIHGQNGSGKSAILAALQICLGAGARRTHRGSNLQDLIRKDHGHQPTHAKLAVTVRNEGEDAFRHEDFGDKITVERTISLRSGGNNGYKLLDQNGKEVSRSRKDLDEMLDHLYVKKTPSERKFVYHSSCLTFCLLYLSTAETFKSKTPWQFLIKKKQRSS